MEDTPDRVLFRLAAKRWPTLYGTVCLQFIDPIADTTFNHRQLPLLLAELQRFAAEEADPPQKRQIGKVCELIESVAGETHTYIKFIGD